MCGSSPVYNGNEETGGGSSTPLPSLTNSSGGIDDQRAARTAALGEDNLQSSLRPRNRNSSSAARGVQQRRSGLARRTMLALSTPFFKG